jgi:hypothetical protein
MKEFLIIICNEWNKISLLYYYLKLAHFIEKESFWHYSEKPVDSYAKIILIKK